MNYLGALFVPMSAGKFEKHKKDEHTTILHSCCTFVNNIIGESTEKKTPTEDDCVMKGKSTKNFIVHSTFLFAIDLLLIFFIRGIVLPTANDVLNSHE